MSASPNDEVRPNDSAPPAAAGPAPAAGAPAATAWQPPPRMSVGRALVIIVLGLGVAGFGLCSLCGGVMGISTLNDKGRMSSDIAMTAFGFSAVGGLLTWLCWWGIKRVRQGARPAAPDATSAVSPSPAEMPGRPATPAEPGVMPPGGDPGPPPAA